MKVTLDLKNGVCVVEKVRGDRKIHGRTNGAGESRLLYKIKQELQKQGFDVIKKRMWKDGHLWGSDYTQYIRTRSQKSGFMIYDADYVFRLANEDFNKIGKVTFRVETY